MRLYLVKFFVRPVQGCFQVVPALQPHPEGWAVAGKRPGSNAISAVTACRFCVMALMRREAMPLDHAKRIHYSQDSFSHPRQYSNDSQPILPRWRCHSLTESKCAIGR